MHIHKEREREREREREAKKHEEWDIAHQRNFENSKFETNYARVFLVKCFYI